MLYPTELRAPGSRLAASARGAIGAGVNSARRVE